MAGFDNPMRDAKTEDVKRHIGQVRETERGIAREAANITTTS